MQVRIRAGEKDPLARFLGWFSIGLGTAQLVAPKALCRLVGANAEGAAPRVMRLVGVRELAQGTGILVRPRPTMWLWSRVAGDALDLALLLATAARNRRVRTALAISNVIAVTIPDVYESQFLSRKQGPVRSGRLVRKAVTINRTREEVERAWLSASELRRNVEEAGASVHVERAPGDRGTELIVEFQYDPPAGDLGTAVEKLAGKDHATRLSDDLRRFKQELETGEVVRSDGTPKGHVLSEHLRQRPARPIEEAVR